MSDIEDSEFSSQFVEEEEDFFLDDDSVDHEEELRLSQGKDAAGIVAEDKEESFRRLLAGPSTNKVYNLEKLEQLNLTYEIYVNLI
jgi:hypothetical protein